QPRCFWGLRCGSEALHYFRDPLARVSREVAQSLNAATIFHGTMQQRGDRFRFVCAVFHRDRTDAKDMRDVRNPCFFPELSTVNPRGVNQCFFELRRELHRYVSLARSMMTVSATTTLASCDVCASGCVSRNVQQVQSVLPLRT